MSKAVFVGDRLSGLAFRPLGVEVREAEDAPAASEQVGRALEEECAVLLITEDCALWASDRLEALRSRVLPAVVVVPAVASAGGMGLERLRRNVEKALGSGLILEDAAPGDPGAGDRG